MIDPLSYVEVCAGPATSIVTKPPVFNAPNRITSLGYCHLSLSNMFNVECR
jgi:hypothetical protein